MDEANRLHNILTGVFSGLQRFNVQHVLRSGCYLFWKRDRFHRSTSHTILIGLETKKRKENYRPKSTCNIVYPLNQSQVLLYPEKIRNKSRRRLRFDIGVPEPIPPHHVFQLSNSNTPEDVLTLHKLQFTSPHPSRLPHGVFPIQLVVCWESLFLGQR